jgi:hypothetical protein
MGGGIDPSQNANDKLTAFMGSNRAVQQNVEATVQALDIDNGVMGKDIGSLIANPLNACVDAQSKLNEAYITEILRLCERKVDDDDENDDAGQIFARIAHMSINTTEGVATIDVPLLTLVQPAQLAISSCRIDFVAEVENNVNMIDRTSAGGDTRSTTNPGILGYVYGGTRVKTRLSSASSTDRIVNSTKKNVYTVNVVAERVENAGMMFLQEMLKSSMKESVKRVERTAVIPLTGSET